MTRTHAVALALLLSIVLVLSPHLTVPTVNAAAGQLFVMQDCSTSSQGRVNVSFSWTGNNPTAIQQWVDLSLFNNGWQPGTFLGNGPLAGTATGLPWDGLTSNAPHYIRINQQLPGGAWDPSPTFQLTTINCGATPESSAFSMLATLVVQAAAPMAGYSRDQFGPAWFDVDDNGCDTRNDILQRDLIDLVLRASDDCIVEMGTLLDPYTGDTIAFVRGVGTSSDVQIEHVVALGAAWRTGAADWSPEKRLQFANDPEHLLAVDGPTNSSKGDRDAAEWLPPNEDFRCAYVAIQIATKVKYTLWVTPAEHAALADVAEDCEPDPLPTDGHLWYTSAASNASVYYCDLDDGWKSLSPANLRAYPSEADLLSAFPGRLKSSTSIC